MKSLILIWSFFYMSLAQAAAPTGIKGQDGSINYSVNAIVPYQQATKLAGVNVLIETDNENMLVNPSFEHTTVATGWTLGTNNTLAATTTSTSLFSGKQAGLLTTNATVAFQFYQNITPPSGLANTQGEVTWAMAVPSTITDGQICSQVNGADQNCISVINNGVYREYNIPIVFGAAAQTAGVRFKTTATYASGTSTVAVDKARVRAGIPTQNLALDYVYSATVITTAGTVSNASKSGWITCTAANPTVCTYAAGIFTVPPNCAVSIAQNSAANAVFSTAPSSTSFAINSFTTSTGVALASQTTNVVCQKQGVDYTLASSLAYSQGNGVATYAQVSGAAANTTAGNPTIFPTVIVDTHGKYNATTGNYVAPAAGTYVFTYTFLGTQTAGSRIQIYKNASPLITCGNQSAANGYTTGSCQANLAAGDSVFLASDANVTSYNALSNWQITKLATGSLIVGSFSGLPAVPGLSGAVDTFSASYGTTNATTACSASPCTFLAQDGTAVTATGFTRGGTGVYTIPFQTTYSKLFCSVDATGAVASTTVTPVYCTSCNSVSFSTYGSVLGTVQDTYGTVNCKGVR